MGTTIAMRIDAAGGRTTGFDYLRLVLAMSIILWHAIPLSYGRQVEIGYWRGPVGIVMHFVLPMFFSLSGFLVAGSLERCSTLFAFFSLRVLRIVPALAMEVTLSACVLGPLLTTATPQDYFGSTMFAAYFLNVAGDIHYVLPGVFAGNPTPSIVNAQLWTIPFELQCYLVMGGLALSAGLRRRRLMLATVILSQAIWAWQAIRLGDDGGSGGASGPVLVIAFLTGILFYLYRDRIRLHPALLIASAVGGALLSSLPHGAYYLPIPACYLTIYLGLLRPPATRIASRNDYSYGLYLYGFPIQQAVASLGPALHGWLANAALSLPLACLVAAFSWHAIERPALQLRRRIPIVEARLRGLALRYRTLAGVASPA